VEIEDFTEEYRGRTYVGHSKKGDPEFSLEKALEDGYNKARADHKNPPFRMIEIWVDGTNPLSEYRVVLGSIT
jgi:hypothetical protein